MGSLGNFFQCIISEIKIRIARRLLRITRGKTNSRESGRRLLRDRRPRGLLREKKWPGNCVKQTNCVYGRVERVIITETDFYGCARVLLWRLYLVVIPISSLDP